MQPFSVSPLLAKAKFLCSVLLTHAGRIESEDPENEDPRTEDLRKRKPLTKTPYENKKPYEIYEFFGGNEIISI